MNNDVKKIVIPDSIKLQTKGIKRTIKVFNVIEIVLIVLVFSLFGVILKLRHKDYRDALLIVQLILVILMSISGHIQRHLHRKLNHLIVEDVVKMAEEEI